MDWQSKELILSLPKRGSRKQWILARQKPTDISEKLASKPKSCGFGMAVRKEPLFLLSTRFRFGYKQVSLTCIQFNQTGMSSMKSFLTKSVSCCLFAGLLIMLLCSQANRSEDLVSANLKLLSEIVDEHDYGNQTKIPENLKQKSDIQSKAFDDAVGKIESGNVSQGISAIVDSEIGFYTDGSYSEHTDHFAHELLASRVWLDRQQ
jgi:hypothetical protein